MSLTQQRMIGDAYPMVGYGFSRDGVAASLTDVQLASTGHAETTPAYWCTSHVMPFAGTVVAISYQLSTAATTGTLTIGPTIAGTEQSDPTLSITTGTSGTDTALRGLVTVAAGDLLGAEITTSAGWDATTADLMVTVWVIHELSGI